MVMQISVSSKFQNINGVGVIKMTCQVVGNITKEYILTKFPETLKGVGKLNDYQKHRRVPFLVRDKVEAKFSRLLAKNIIKEADGSTGWVFFLL